MKRILLPLLALCLTMTATAQKSNEGTTKNHAVYLELLGGSSEIGVNYDARFNKHTRWGWRAGLGFAYSESSGCFDHSNSIRAWSVPFGINYLIGNKKNYLELELGASLGLYNGHYEKWTSHSDEISKADYERYTADRSLLPDNATPAYDPETQKGYLIYNEYHQATENKFGYFFFGDIGYRHVANSGFLFRIGLNPLFNFGGEHAVYRVIGNSYAHKLSMGFYLGFGWAF